MIYGFKTKSREHARIALILYAIYRSREKNSSLNGLDTWKRFNSYVAGAVEESENIREFMTIFSKKAGTQALQWNYLNTGEAIPIGTMGELINIDGLYNVRMDFFEDDELLELLRSEYQYIILLVRERCEREKEAILNGKNT